MRVMTAMMLYIYILFVVVLLNFPYSLALQNLTKNPFKMPMLEDVVVFFGVFRLRLKIQGRDLTFKTIYSEVCTNPEAAGRSNAPSGAFCVTCF